MSRTYQKYLSVPHYEFDPPDWPAFRVQERTYIGNELHSVEHGNVVFSRYYGSRHGSWYASKRHYYPKNNIRDTFFTEIRNILNGYMERMSRWREEDARETFIEAFNRIKNGECQDGRKSCFDWLNTSEAKEAVRNWGGDPIDVLYHLTNAGIIEKAVRKECKRMLRK